MPHLIGVPEHPKEIPLDALKEALKTLGILQGDITLERLHSVRLGPGSWATITYTAGRDNEIVHIKRKLSIR